MDNPVLVEVTRGTQVESQHRGSVSVIDADGSTVLALGDVECRVFPRSAVKALQALPLIESGAADAFGFGDAELALACASHNGEPRHVETARAALAAAGLGELLLSCAEVDVTVRHDGITFADPEQKNVVAAMGGMVGQMAVGLDFGKMFELTMPVHDRIAQILGLVARATQ